MTVFFRVLLLLLVVAVQNPHENSLNHHPLLYYEEVKPVASLSLGQFSQIFLTALKED